MIWHLVALVFAGLGGAGIALVLRSLTRKKLPVWIVPVLAGTCMLGYQINFEYAWYDHKLSQLPEGSVITGHAANPSFFRPWTFVFPMTTEFHVIDAENIRRGVTDNTPVAQFVEYHFEKQYVDVVTFTTYILNCQTGEQVPINSDGTPDISGLSMVSAQDLRRQTVCG
ncbi:hypothetical protein ACFOSD_02680 [Salinispirillum marinum]|uniref:Uncharacterized protein n=2 Tax=Saccharospirillaceae TaxID=255527 RepID=A0ABV8BAQ0_9GAMM